MGNSSYHYINGGLECQLPSAAKCGIISAIRRFISAHDNTPSFLAAWLCLEFSPRVCKGHTIWYSIVIIIYLDLPFTYMGVSKNMGTPKMDGL